MRSQRLEWLTKRRWWLRWQLQSRSQWWLLRLPLHLQPWSLGLWQLRCRAKLSPLQCMCRRWSLRGCELAQADVGDGAVPVEGVVVIHDDG